MSAGVICDNCNTVLAVMANGDDADGERAGWLTIEAGGMSWDLCTRACALHLLDDPASPLVGIMESYQEAIAAAVQAINAGYEMEIEEEDD
jgi:hypothetical protein